MAGTPDYKKLHEIEVKFSDKYGSRFVHDGIICDGYDEEDDYFEGVDEGKRILWILKEANKEDDIKKNPKGWYLRDYLWEVANGEETGKHWKASFLLVAKISYAIINESAFCDVPADVEKIFKKIAVIDVKKTGGGSQADKYEIASYYQNDKQLLLEQIRAIQPETIINCSRVDDLFNDFVVEFKATGVKEIPCPDKADVVFKAAASKEGVWIIDAYQPNQRELTHEQYFNTIMEECYKYLKQF
jgi:hypothetical protein